jgi:hypothetical protein
MIEDTQKEKKAPIERESERALTTPSLPQLECWDEDDKNQNSSKCDRLGSAVVPWKKLWRDETEGSQMQQVLYLKVRAVAERSA